MKPKVVEFPNGALAALDKSNGMYSTWVRSPLGEVIDQVTCFDYREAMAYFKSFKKIAKNYSGPPNPPK